MSELVTIHNQIARLFLEEMNLDVPSVDLDLLESGILDSLAFVDLLLHLERKFEIEISIDELEIDNFRSIEKIAEFVSAYNTSYRLK